MGLRGIEVQLKVSVTAIWTAAASEARRRFGLCLCRIHLKTSLSSQSGVALRLPPHSIAMPIYALTIFIGAFLLFQVQPLIGKYILPWFGGGPGVWTTCMLFFQVALLGGYAYAHLISQRLKPRTQAIVHLCLVFTALALLPVTPSDSWKPHGAENPALHILLLLTATIGLPYFVLS